MVFKPFVTKRRKRQPRPWRVQLGGHRPRYDDETSQSSNEELGVQMTTGTTAQQMEPRKVIEEVDVEQASKEPAAALYAGSRYRWSAQRARWQAAGLAAASACASWGASSGNPTSVKALSALADGLRVAATWRTEAEAFNKSTALETLGMQLEAARHAENLEFEHRRHLHDLTAALREAQQESDRDLWAQRLSRQQSLTTVASLLFAAAVALVVEGELPSSAAEKSVLSFIPLVELHYTVIAVGLGMLLFVVIGGVKLSNFMNAFTSKRVAYHNDFLDIKLRIKYCSLRSLTRRQRKQRRGIDKSTTQQLPIHHNGAPPPLPEKYHRENVRDELTDLLNQRVAMTADDDDDYVVTFSKWYEMECAHFSHSIDKAFSVGTLCVMVGLTTFVWARLDHVDRDEDRQKSRLAAVIFIVIIVGAILLVFAAPRLVKKALDTHALRLVCCKGVRYDQPTVYSIGQIHDRVTDLFDLIITHARSRAPDDSDLLTFDDVLSALHPSSAVYDDIKREIHAVDLDARLPDIGKIFLDALRRAFPGYDIKPLKDRVDHIRNDISLSMRMKFVDTSSRLGYERSTAVDAATLEAKLEDSLFFAHQRSATRLDYTRQDDDFPDDDVFSDDDHDDDASATRPTDDNV